MNMQNVYVQNPEQLAEKTEQMRKQGIRNLHVVSDFDRTLTKCNFDGKRIPSAVSCIREGGYLTEDYAPKAFALFDKYHPIEIDDNLDYEYKVAKMQEWWQTHMQLLVDSGMNEKVIEDVLKRYPKLFRDGALQFFDQLKEQNIPLLIFSAGIGNLIEGYLRKEGRLTSNVHILSNTFEFDAEGLATGYKNRVIHVLNKSETKIENPEYRKLIDARKNVILLGDSLGDLGMVSDIDAHAIIKIGFLNEEIKEKLALYQSKFDVVITNDGTMDYPNALLSQLTESSE